MPSAPQADLEVVRYGTRATALVAAEVFTAGPIDALGHGQVRGLIRAGVAAGGGGPFIQFSPDGTNFDVSIPIPVDPLQPAFTYDFIVDRLGRFVRFVFTDAGAGTTPFRALLTLEP